jgi:soluble lytic murein transglycosylase-like protein
MILLLAAAAAAAAAQQPDPYQAIRAIQEASVQKQRESVRRQVASSVATRDSFFTVPFLNNPLQASVTASEPAEECEALPEEELRDAIEDAARREGLTPDLLRAMIGQESGFRPCAVSRRGAQGLMQLMPATQAQFGVSDAFDARQNIGAGAKLMKRLLDRYGGDLALALGAYNAGPGHVDRYGGVPLFPETLNYVSSVLEKLAPR